MEFIILKFSMLTIQSHLSPRPTRYLTLFVQNVPKIIMYIRKKEKRKEGNPF